MRERSGLGDAKVRSKRRSRRSDSSDTPTRATFYAYRTGRTIRMLAFADTPQRYDALGGSRLPLVTYDEDGSLTRLLEPVPEIVPPSADNAVLVHANSHRLTEKMVTDTLVFAEFLAAGPLSQQDRVALRHEVIAEFPSISEKDYQTYADIGHLIESMYNRSGVTHGEVNTAMLMQIWQTWDEANRQKYLRVARVKNVVKPDDVPQAARNLEA